ncbi:MAG: hypothetical protein J5769_03825 [Bacteroidales bacterium]|nr:hypothetical protein [Bacteroidales bacterium]
MKRIFATIALACVTVCAFAQGSIGIFRPRLEIASYEEDENTVMEVFYMNDESPRVYYLSVGNLGIGSNIIQIGFDPVYELFIPLGGTLEEVLFRLQELKDFCKQPKGTTMEIQGLFSVAYPTGDPVTITATSRRFIFTKQLEFSIPTEKEGVVRATRMSRGKFNGIIASAKMYKFIHPDEP